VSRVEVKSRLQGFKASRLQGFKASRLQGFKASRQQYILNLKPVSLIGKVGSFHIFVCHRVPMSRPVSK
jgi:hypothetical protein